MAAQNGKDLLIKLDLTGGGQFTTIAGLRATRISFNAETVDVTNLESQGGWRELLGGAGVRSASVSGSGIFVDSAGDLRLLMHSYAVSQNLDHYWGFWYTGQNDPLADLTLGEDPGDGADRLVDYLPTISDVTSTSDFHDTNGSNGSNVATIFPLDTTTLWVDKPAAVTYGPLNPHEGNGADGDAVIMHLDLN